ncbi:MULTISPECIES: GPW/gp25 family protein [Bacteroides]|nr:MULTISPECIES: GPW/gp25 family protein [Bacteroides]
MNKVLYEQDIQQSLDVLFGVSSGERVNCYDYGVHSMSILPK